jgi:hypothetical protein
MGVSGTLRVVVVYSIIYIKKKEKRTAEPSDQTGLNNTKPSVLMLIWNCTGTLRFIRYMEHGVATEYFGDYVRKENASQVTLNAWVRGCSRATSSRRATGK